MDDADDDSRWPVALDPELTERVRELAVELGVSYFTVILGAFFVTLHHHTGSTDLIVSVPYHGRQEKELKEKVGYFVNTLPLRQRIRPEDSYADLLRELRATIRTGLRHGALPLSAILRSANLLGPAHREQNRQFVFRHWNTAAKDGFDAAGFELVGDRARCSVTMLDPTTVTNYRLTVLLTEGDVGVRLHWLNTDGSVGRAATDALARDHLNVVADLVATPSRTLAEAVALLPAVSHPGVVPAVAAPADPQQAPPVTVAAVTVAEVGAIWTEVLRVPDLLPEDSFFELGGHSLIAATLLARINERLGVEISIRELFSHPRLVDMAGLVDRQRSATPATTVVETPQSESEEWGEVFPAAGFQEGIWLAQRLDPEHARYHIPLTWRVDGELTPERLRAALALLIARHEILRTRFVDHDGRSSARRSARPGNPRWRRWSRARRPQPSSGSGCAGGAMTPPTASTRPPDGCWRRACSRCPPASGCSPCASTIWCSTASRSRCCCANWQAATSRRARTGCSPQSPQAAPVPGVGPRPAGRRRTGAGDGGSGVLGRPAGRRSQHARAERGGLVPTGQHRPAAGERPGTAAGPGTTALAGVAVHGQGDRAGRALHRWSGQHDLTFGVPVANRAGGAFDEVLGPCLNTVVLRSRCTADSTLADLLRATRECVIEAFEHQSAPFDEVVRRLRPARSAGRTPYVDFMLNNVSTADWSGTLGAARLTSLDHDLQDEESNKFRLTVTFSGREDGLLGTLAYRGGFLTAETAGQLAANWLTC